MISQAIDLEHRKYNCIILAAGSGSRMNAQSLYLPKTLSQIGSERAIDYTIQRYKNITENFIIATSYHHDLLSAYLKGKYPSTNIQFSIEKPEHIKNNATSTMLALDKADSRLPTIVIFSDLIMLGNIITQPNTLYYINSNTKGYPTHFRHSITIVDNKVRNINEHHPPILHGGIVGCFIFENTKVLKSIAYSNDLIDLTTSIVKEYNKVCPLAAEPCDALIEFGTEEQLLRAREIWETI